MTLVHFKRNRDHLVRRVREPGMPISQNSYCVELSRVNMSVTPYQAKYFAHELSKPCASDSSEKLCRCGSQRPGGSRLSILLAARPLALSVNLSTLRRTLEHDRQLFRDLRGCVV